MSGALNSVLGGSGGGGLLGAIGGIVGGAFGGPIGAMIGQAVGNLLQKEVGQAINEGVNDLQQNHGMPKFVGDQIKSTTAQTLAGLRDNSVPADVESAAQQQFGSALTQFRNDFKDEWVASVLSQRGSESEGGGGRGWLQAIAKAMGQTLGQKAQDMVRLSGEMSALSDKRSANTASYAAENGGRKGEQATTVGDAISSRQDQDNAMQFNKLMTEFQATSQEYSLLNNTFTTAIKALGEALGSMARKQ